MFLLIFTALTLFIITHTDAFILLVAFCIDAEYSTREVFVGHAIGFSGTIVAVILGSVFASEIIQQRAFLFGIVPLVLGIWGILNRGESTPLPSGTHHTTHLGRIWVVTVASLGLAGENLAILIPFFLGFTPFELALIILLYVFCGGMLFVLALFTARKTTSIGLPPWLEEWVVPFTLIAVGVYVLSTGYVTA